VTLSGKCPHFTSAATITQVLEVLMSDEDVEITGMGKEYGRKDGRR
jgi:hypothetical protein